MNGDNSRARAETPPNGKKERKTTKGKAKLRARKVKKARKKRVPLEERWIEQILEGICPEQENKKRGMSITEELIDDIAGEEEE